MWKGEKGRDGRVTGSVDSGRESCLKIIRVRCLREQSPEKMMGLDQVRKELPQAKAEVVTKTGVFFRRQNRKGCLNAS